MAESEATALLERELATCVAERDSLWNKLGDTQAERDSLWNKLGDTQAERDSLRDQRDQALGDLDNQRLYTAEHRGYARIAGEKLAAAEARVEALSEALRAILLFESGHSIRHNMTDKEMWQAMTDIARAALTRAGTT
jgi:uncharacterized coiled-coil DUF342 family protein